MPDGTGKKVSITLPENMTEEQFTQLFGTFQKQRVTGKLKGTATGKALKRLVSLHQPEYDGIYEEEYAKAKKAGVA